MVQYFDGGDLACFDGLSFRKDKRTGYFLNAKTHKRLHVYVWEHFNGEVPKGFHVHHKDMNKGNNEIDNLEILSAKEHEKLHGSLISEGRKEWMRKNLADNARPKASEWHGSENGKQWHSEHAQAIWQSASVRKYICQYCGAEFETRNVYGENQAKFCSNKCRAANRRKSGVDDVEKICEKCGQPYMANKYSKTRFCKGCGHKKH